ncbi:unnamed protein product, partial [Ostreobium quekettii]
MKHNALVVGPPSPPNVRHGLIEGGPIGQKATPEARATPPLSPEVAAKVEASSESSSTVTDGEHGSSDRQGDFPPAQLQGPPQQTESQEIVEWVADDHLDQPVRLAEWDVATDEQDTSLRVTWDAIEVVSGTAVHVAVPWVRVTFSVIEHGPGGDADIPFGWEAWDDAEDEPVLGWATSPL